MGALVVLWTLGTLACYTPILTMKNQQSTSSAVRPFLPPSWWPTPPLLVINGLVCRVQHLPLKRLFDIIFSAAILLIFSPLFLLIGFAIALSSKGHVIFSQKRMGRGGRPFLCFKFRSMYLDAEQRLEELLEKDVVARREWESTRKLKRDPRITPLGRLLRKTSLDELPQFWNVLKGELSVVGPRPVPKNEIETFFGKHAAKVLSIRPGLTCTWQVSGRNNVTYADRVMMDERYVRERSFWMDLKLIARTLPAMLFANGAY